MVSPYHPEKLKSSSLELDIGDLVIYWDDKGKHCEKTLADGDTFVLEPNSVVFIKTAQKFRMPHYLAIRFNLKITNVHRGLLLGTGPLVDPGFEGHLLIPVHNLTKNPYTFEKNEGFIWVEFTKISPNGIWDQNTQTVEDQVGKYIAFPHEKIVKDVREYLKKAAPHKSIQNAIPDSIRAVRETANKAEEHATSAKRTLFGFGIGGGIATVVAVGSIVISSHQSYTGFNEVIAQSNEAIAAVKKEYDLPKKSSEIIVSLRDLNIDLRNLTQKLQNIESANNDKIALTVQNKEITELKQRVKDQEAKIEKLIKQNEQLKAQMQTTTEH